MKILRLNSGVGVTRPVVSGASFLTIVNGRFKGWMGLLANRLGLPAVLSEIEITDELTGQRVSIRKGVYFTIVSLDGRDYYFKRLTGKFDGTGYQMKC
jgi:hypothetical protein